MKPDPCYGGKVRRIMGGFTGGWQTCTACDGRIHDQHCTSKVDPTKDCCPLRHKRMGLPIESAQVRARATGETP